MSPTFKELTVEGRDKGDRPAMIMQGEKWKWPRRRATVVLRDSEREAVLPAQPEESCSEKQVCGFLCNTLLRPPPAAQAGCPRSLRNGSGTD